MSGNIPTPAIEWTAFGLLIFLAIKCLPGIVRNLREDKQSTLNMLAELMAARTDACQKKLDLIIAWQKEEHAAQRKEHAAERAIFENTLREILNLAQNIRTPAVVKSPPTPPE